MTREQLSFLSGHPSLASASWAAVDAFVKHGESYLTNGKFNRRQLFVATSLMICLVFGAFIGDVIGKRRESISFFINNKLRK